MIHPRVAVRTLTAFGLATTLAACGGSSTSVGSMPMASSTSASSAMPSTTTARFNQQDATFATNMIIHHRQAIEMAKLAAGRSSDPRVADLAKRIEAAQAPEIATMSGWLTAWGRPVPQEMAGMSMTESTPGMMSPEDMTKLAATKGTSFDMMFSAMMINHHQGAITMAKQESGTGMNPEATSLAGRVVTDQTAEISEMHKMVG